MHVNRKHLSHIGTAIFSILLFAAALWGISKELKGYKFSDILTSLAALPKDRIGWAIVMTALGDWAMTVYDVLALYYIRHPLPYRKAAFAAFTSFTISNNLGFALLTSSAIRYRLYSAWGLSVVEIAQTIAFGNISFWLGMLAIGGILFLIEPLPIPGILNLPVSSINILGGIFLALVLGYLILCIVSHHKPLKIGKSVFFLPSWRISIAQIIISALDWVLASGVLYILIPSSTPFSFSAFFANYLLAQFAGVISHVPGGLGVFEGALVLLLSPVIPAHQTLIGLLAYRAIYYLLPFVVASMMLVIYEIRLRAFKIKSK
jgi:uncharacterized membrane protein YbhN (UPF0104 family)